MGLRNLVPVLVAVLALHGTVAQGLVPALGTLATHSQDCPGHDHRKGDCPCCPDESPSSLDCTSQCCAHGMTVAVQLPLLQRARNPPFTFVAAGSGTLSHAPLNPPPIA
jgi:hypothetical protein